MPRSLKKMAASEEAAKERLVTRTRIWQSLVLESDADTAGEVELGLGIGDGGVEVSLGEDLDKAEGQEHTSAGVADGGSRGTLRHVVHTHAEVEVRGDGGGSAAGTSARREREELSEGEAGGPSGVLLAEGGI